MKHIVTVKYRQENTREWLQRVVGPFASPAAANVWAHHAADTFVKTKYAKRQSYDMGFTKFGRIVHDHGVHVTAAGTVIFSAIQDPIESPYGFNLPD